jgi:hypothetical protein
VCHQSSTSELDMVPDMTSVMMYFGGDNTPDYSLTTRPTRRRQGSTRICFSHASAQQSRHCGSRLTLLNAAGFGGSTTACFSLANLLDPEHKSDPFELTLHHRSGQAGPAPIGKTFDIKLSLYQYVSLAAKEGPA